MGIVGFRRVSPVLLVWLLARNFGHVHATAAVSSPHLPEHRDNLKLALNTHTILVGNDPQHNGRTTWSSEQPGNEAAAVALVSEKVPFEYEVIFQHREKTSPHNFGLSPRQAATGINMYSSSRTRRGIFPPKFIDSQSEIPATTTVENISRRDFQRPMMCFCALRDIKKLGGERRPWRRGGRQQKP